MGIGGENLIAVHGLRRVDVDVLMVGEIRRIGKVVQLGKHRLGLAVVAVEHRHAILKVRAVVPLGIDAAAGEIGLVHTVIVVKQIVGLALHHGVIDDGTGHLNPSIDLVVKGSQFIKVNVSFHVAGIAVGIHRDIRQHRGG